MPVPTETTIPIGWNHSLSKRNKDENETLIFPEIRKSQNAGSSHYETGFSIVGGSRHHLY